MKRMQGGRLQAQAEFHRVRISGVLEEHDYAQPAAQAEDRVVKSGDAGLRASTWLGVLAHAERGRAAKHDQDSAVEAGAPCVPSLPEACGPDVLCRWRWAT